MCATSDESLFTLPLDLHDFRQDGFAATGDVLSLFATAGGVPNPRVRVFVAIGGKLCLQFLHFVEQGLLSREEFHERRHFVALDQIPLRLRKRQNLLEYLQLSAEEFGESIGGSVGVQVSRFFEGLKLANRGTPGEVVIPVTTAGAGRGRKIGVFAEAAEHGLCLDDRGVLVAGAF